MGKYVDETDEECVEKSSIWKTKRRPEVVGNGSGLCPVVLSLRVLLSCQSVSAHGHCNSRHDYVATFTELVYLLTCSFMIYLRISSQERWEDLKYDLKHISLKCNKQRIKCKSLLIFA
jgi:hypothetical protein